MTVSRPAPQLSDVFGGLMLKAMKEVMGRAGLHAALSQSGLLALAEDLQAGKSNLALSYSDWARILAVLEEMHGARGAKGLALRFGRALFPDLLRRFGQQAGLLDARFRLLAPRPKMHMGLQAVAAILKQEAGLNTFLDENGPRYRWVPLDFSQCAAVDQSGCYLLVGLLQEFFYWASGGKYYTIEEAACVLLIDKQALD